LSSASPSAEDEAHPGGIGAAWRGRQRVCNQWVKGKSFDTFCPIGASRALAPRIARRIKSCHVPIGVSHVWDLRDTRRDTPMGI
jgi:hypothetical protein